jgi:hypothetical protein
MRLIIFDPKIIKNKKIMNLKEKLQTIYQYIEISMDIEDDVIATFNNNRLSIKTLDSIYTDEYQFNISRTYCAFVYNIDNVPTYLSAIFRSHIIPLYEITDSFKVGLFIDMDKCNILKVSYEDTLDLEKNVLSFNSLDELLIYYDNNLNKQHPYNEIVAYVPRNSILGYVINMNLVKFEVILWGIIRSVLIIQKKYNILLPIYFYDNNEQLISRLDIATNIYNLLAGKTNDNRYFITNKNDVDTTEAYEKYANQLELVCRRRINHVMKNLMVQAGSSDWYYIKYMKYKYKYLNLKKYDPAVY